MNQQQVAFLRRLIETEPPFRPYSSTAEYLLNAEGIGKVQGRRVVYTQRDFAAARNLLKVRSFEISRQVEPVPRSQVQPGESEKWGALRVSEGLVAVVPLGLPEVLIPTGSMLCMDVRQALALPFEVLVFCENLEPMLRLHEYCGWRDSSRGAPRWRCSGGHRGTSARTWRTSCWCRTIIPCWRSSTSTPRGCPWLLQCHGAKHCVCRRWTPLRWLLKGSGARICIWGPWRCHDLIWRPSLQVAMWGSLGGS